jgi:hypothetical protein
VIATAAAALYAAEMLGHARAAGPSCFLGQCVQGDRYAEAAALAIAAVLVAGLASLRTAGWLLSAWSAGTAAVVLGTASLVFPAESGALPGTWAVAAVIWGGTFIATAQAQHGTSDRRQSPADPAGLVTLRLGISRIYLLPCTGGYLQIDTAYHRQYADYRTALARAGIGLAQLRYLLLTHHHDDHAGFLGPLTRDTDLTVIAHRDAAALLAGGANDRSRGGGFVTRRMNLLARIKMRLDPSWTLTFPRSCCVRTTSASDPTTTSCFALSASQVACSPRRGTPSTRSAWFWTTGPRSVATPLPTCSAWRAPGTALSS